MIDITSKDWDFSERVLRALCKHRFTEREIPPWDLGMSDRQLLETLLPMSFPEGEVPHLTEPDTPWFVRARPAQVHLILVYLGFCPHSS